MHPCHCDPVRLSGVAIRFPSFGSTDSHASVLCSALRAASGGCALHAPAGAVAQNDKVVCILQQSPTITWYILILFLKYQLIIAGFRIFFHSDRHAGQFGDHQFAGGVDDAAADKVAADGGEIFPGQRNVQMTAPGADGSVQADDLAVFPDIPDGNATGIPDPSL